MKTWGEDRSIQKEVQVRRRDLDSNRTSKTLICSWKAREGTSVYRGCILHEHRYLRLKTYSDPLVNQRLKRLTLNLSFGQRVCFPIAPSDEGKLLEWYPLISLNKSRETYGVLVRSFPSGIVSRPR